MRAPFLIAASLALAACSNKDQHDNTINADESVAAENIVSNDVTAIDAVTGDAANMAADAEIPNVTEPADNAGGNDTTAKPPRFSPKPAPKTHAAEPAGNSAAPVTSNNAE